MLPPPQLFSVQLNYWTFTIKVPFSDLNSILSIEYYIANPCNSQKIGPSTKCKICVPKGVVLQSDEMCFFNQKPFTFAFAKQNISVANYLQFTNEICFQNSKICNSKIGNPAPAWSISWQHWITCQPATLLFLFYQKVGRQSLKSHIFKSIFLQCDEECPLRCL